MPDYCLICDAIIPFEITWSAIIREPDPQFLCRDCEKQLSLIQAPTCQKCSRSLNKLTNQFIKGNLCLDCHRWEEDSKWAAVLEKNISFYEYNSFLKELLARFKFRGDYVLAKIFSQKIVNTLKSVEYDYIVPIPLSKERLKERGFNQAAALANEANLETINLLTRTHSEKQSKKSRQERIHIEQVFHLNEDQPTQGKKMILIDDIYTTGSTLRHAAKLLKSAGADTVIAITIARG
ncbi:amidophosphoribosyltransferase [Heyndrickxia sporothermodurans]|nr:amidophosphoribosyltransferase [Heyndrickxia sporothermodurans]